MSSQALTSDGSSRVGEILVNVATSPHGALSVARTEEGELVYLRRLVPESAGQMAAIAERRSDASELRPWVLDLVRVVEEERVVASRFTLGMPLSLVARVLMTKRTRLPPSHAAQWMLDVLEGLGALAGGDYTPGGLTPDHVIVAAEGGAHLLEARIAALLSAGLRGKSERTGYRAPEQVEGEPATPASDVFAVGVMLWELLHSRRAFPGLDVAQVELQVKNGPPKMSAEVPEALAEVVGRALESRPEDRFADAAEMRAALRAACPDLPSTAELASAFDALFGAHPAFSRIRKKTAESARAGASKPKASGPSEPRVTPTLGAAPAPRVRGPKKTAAAKPATSVALPGRRQLPPPPGSGLSPGKRRARLPTVSGLGPDPRDPPGVIVSDDDDEAPTVVRRVDARAIEAALAAAGSPRGRSEAPPDEAPAPTPPEADVTFELEADDIEDAVSVGGADEGPVAAAPEKPPRAPVRARKAVKAPRASEEAERASRSKEAEQEPEAGGANEVDRTSAHPRSESIHPADSYPPPNVGTQATRHVGRCELFAEIAQGGMATVHLGRWLGAGGFVKTVAVKALHPQYARDPEFVRMFLDEARVVARVRHPNVMPTIDLVEDEGELFIVMEFVHGATLAHLLRQMKRRRERMPVGIALKVITGVLHGLHAAHEATDGTGKPMSVIHRDVSPENILVGVDGYARLIDFGIASALGRTVTTKENQVKGKPSYLSPEQVLGKSLDRRTDVYSAAVVLWEALTGRRLFKGDNLGALTFKIMNADLKPPSAMRSEVSHEVDAIVMRGLERDRDDRWPSAEEMSEALERLGGQTSLRAVGSWVRAVAAERLERSERALKAIEATPLAVSDDELKVPLKVQPAPAAKSAPALSEPLEADTDDDSAATSGDSEASADAMVATPFGLSDDEADLVPRRRLPWLGIGIAGATAAAALLAISLSGDDATSERPERDVPEPALGSPAPKADVPVTMPEPTVATSPSPPEPIPQPASKPEPEPQPQPEPQSEPQPEPKPKPAPQPTKAVAPKAPPPKPIPSPPPISAPKPVPPKPKPRLPDDI